jgi:hypothetical protein
MIKITLNLKSNEYFLKVLELLSPFFPFNGLSKREREVLSLLLLHNYEKIEIPYDDRMKIIFNYTTRQALAETLKISVFNLNNLMKGLRDKGFIGSDNINKKFLLTPETHGEFLFTFKYSQQHDS